MKRYSSGASLIEVLVSVAVSAIGLLALAAVNASSVKLTAMSQHKGIAVQLVNDIGERIRANRTATKSAAFAYVYIAGFDSQHAPDRPEELCNSVASNCTQEQIAAADMFAWRTQVTNLLPDGRVYLENIPDPDPTSSAGAMNVWVAWRDPVLLSAGPAAANACPSGSGADADPTIRCLFTRINY